MIYKVQQGKHAFQPYNPIAVVPNCRLFLPGIHFRFRFTEQSIYELDGEDQNDWNKGGGVRFHLFDNTINSLMWAWRWKPKFERMQITAYAHKDREQIVGWGDWQVFQNMPLGEWGEAWIFPRDNSRKAWTIQTMYGNTIHANTIDFGKKFRIVGRIDPWFGGDDSDDNGIGGVAPKDLQFESIYKNFKP